MYCKYISPFTVHIFSDRIQIKFYSFHKEKKIEKRINHDGTWTRKLELFFKGRTKGKNVDNRSPRHNGHKTHQHKGMAAGSSGTNFKGGEWYVKTPGSKQSSPDRLFISNPRQMGERKKPGEIALDRRACAFAFK